MPPRWSASRRHGELRTIVNGDPDRRVRTEALRVIVQYDDENAFGVVVNYLDRQRHLVVGVGGRRRAAVQVPSGRDGVAGERILRQVQAAGAAHHRPDTARPTFQPGAAAELAGALLATDSVAARNAAFQALGRTGAAGRAKLDQLAKDPAMAQYQTQIAAAITANEAAAARAAGAGQPGQAAGRAGGAGGGGGRGNTRPPIPARPDAEYRALVEKWIVPAYNGAPAPRAIWETPKGAIELELYPGDAPFGVEHFFRVVESGDIVGTEFTRLVPNFVAQQQAIRNASTPARRSQPVTD